MNFNDIYKIRIFGSRFLKSVVFSTMIFEFSACASVSRVPSKPLRPGFEIQGHRGARAMMPENTLPAFEYALNAGVDVLELDVGVTADDQLVVSHDRRVDTAICRKHSFDHERSGPLIRSLTLEQIREYDCGSYRNRRFPSQLLIPGTRMPLLAEVFDLIQNSTNPWANNIGFNIETKIDEDHPSDTVAPVVFVNLLVKLIESRGLESRVVIQSFDFRTLRLVKSQYPKIRISALVDSKSLDYADLIKDLGPDIISPNYRKIDKGKIELIQSFGIRVIPWTVNKRSDWVQLIDDGVDGIITDDPKPLVESLRK